MRFSNIKIVLFDVDGTLLDTTELIFRCYEHTIKKHKLSPKTRKEISVIFGKPLEACYQLLFPCEDVVKLSETHLSFQEKNLYLSKPFINVEKTLYGLNKRGFKIAALTSRSKRTSIKSLEVNNIASYIDLIISREDIINPKPHPESLLKALKYFNASPKHAIMVGDTRVDIKAGRNAKTKTIGVTYGPLGNVVKEASPDIVISDISEIINIVIRH
jgi:pyrophosphatase PpaX